MRTHRLILGIALLTLCGVVVPTVAADEKSNSIVIKPKGTQPIAPPPAPQQPKNDQYVVIKPQKPGEPTKPATPPATAPRQLEGEKKSDSMKPMLPTGDIAPIAEPKPIDDSAKAASTQKGKIILETWDAAYLKGHQVGYFHTVIREREANDKTYLYATREQRLTLKRFGQMTTQSTEDATLETLDGAILTTRMEVALGPQQKLTLTGRVVDNTLRTKAEGAIEKEESVPWPQGVLGIAKEATLYRDRKPKPGDTFDYRLYEGRLNRAISVTVTAKAVENVAIVQGFPPRMMLRLEAVSEPIKDENGKVVLRFPPATIWCDATTFEPMRTDQDMPSLGGRLTILRTDEKTAKRPPMNVPDLFDVQSIRLDREIANVHDKSQVIYRITMTGEAEPGEAIPSDGRQTVKNIDAAKGTLELHVTAVREPKGDGAKVVPDERYLGQSFFIDWNDAAVKKHAAAAVATLPATASDWRKAVAIEKWVNANMRAVEFSQAMGTASQVAKTLSGDCTEYAMLAAAMCRANAIPSRTALGLVYAPGPGGRPFLAYHMWFEVYVGGEWLALDGTLGRGAVGPGHIKITDAHWHEERTFAPLLPVLRVLMATPKVEVANEK